MNKDNKLILEENITGFKYKKNLSNLNVSFNRIAFIFFAFLIVFILYSSKIIFLSNLEINLKKIYLQNRNLDQILLIEMERLLLKV